MYKCPKKHKMSNDKQPIYKVGIYGDNQKVAGTSRDMVGIGRNNEKNQQGQAWQAASVREKL